MAKYEKWLGAGLGWMVGGPIGGLIGFLTGNMMSQNQTNNNPLLSPDISEFEVNLIVLASHLIHIDGTVTISELNFINKFLNRHFDKKYATERAEIINHCLQNEYDLNIVCHALRNRSSLSTREQIIHFLFDLAQCDETINQREEYFIFRISGYLNVNDVAYKKIKKEHQKKENISVYDTLGVKPQASNAEIRTAYRKLVLQHHPDRNKQADETEKKRLAAKFQQIQEAYEKIKSERGEV